MSSAAYGEFVAESRMWGGAERREAMLRLRIASERQSDVLNEIRALGSVQSESTKADDATAQVVDLEARLRNERRVEAELLDLMDRRENANLTEVLELRRELSRVRAEIERMTAQRDTIAGLVRLATIVVFIRPNDAIDSLSEGLAHSFPRLISEAWHDGLRILGWTFAWLIKLLVGGAVLWLAITVGMITVIYLRRRAEQ